jgi:hypothetical protein
MDSGCIQKTDVSFFGCAPPETDTRSVFPTRQGSRSKYVSGILEVVGVVVDVMWRLVDVEVLGVLLPELARNGDGEGFQAGDANSVDGMGSGVKPTWYICACGCIGMPI